MEVKGRIPKVGLKVRCRTVFTVDAIVAVEQSIKEGPNEFIRHGAPHPLWRIKRIYNVPNI